MLSVLGGAENTKSICCWGICIVIVVLIICFGYYAYKNMMKGSMFDNLRTGGNNPHWHLGMRDAGTGGNIDRSANPYAGETYPVAHSSANYGFKDYYAFKNPWDENVTTFIPNSTVYNKTTEEMMMPMATNDSMDLMMMKNRGMMTQ